MASDKIKIDRFKRVASKRVDNTIKSLRSLAKCSNTSNYEYSESDVNKMIKAIKDELKIMETLYENNLKKQNEKFKF